MIGNILIFLNIYHLTIHVVNKKNMNFITDFRVTEYYDDTNIVCNINVETPRRD